MPTIDRRSFVRTAGAASVGALTTLAGCQGNTGGDSSTLHIGTLQPLSGPYATAGVNIRNGVQLGVEAVNADDSDVEMEVTHKDSEGSADAGVERARELVQQDQVDVLSGMISSSVANAVGEFGTQQGIPVVNMSAQSESLTGENCRRELFTMSTNESQMAKAVGRTVADVSADGATIAGIIPNYSFGNSAWKYFTRYIENNTDSEIVAETFPAPGQGDFQNEIQTVLDADPDVIYTAVWAGDLITLMQQGKQYDLFEEVSEFVHGAGSIMGVSQALGDDMEEIIAATGYVFNHPDPDYEGNQEFVDSWQEKYGTVPPGVGGLTYGGVHGMKHAIEESGGTSTDDLINGLEGLEFQAPAGRKKIRETDHVVIEENVWTGRMGPVDAIDYYGMTEVFPTPGDEVTREPRCEL